MFNFTLGPPRQKIQPTGGHSNRIYWKQSACNDPCISNSCCSRVNCIYFPTVCHSKSKPPFLCLVITLQFYCSLLRCYISPLMTPLSWVIHDWALLLKCRMCVFINSAFFLLNILSVNFSVIATEPKWVIFFLLQLIWLNYPKWPIS